MIDTDKLFRTLDLWRSMWSDEERLAFETALVRSLTDEQPRSVRELAFAACQVIATPRLLAAATHVAGRDDGGACDVIAAQMRPLRKRLDDATQLRGNLLLVEHMLSCVVSGRGLATDDDTLDWIDIRDLVAVAWTTLDARLYREIERRVAQRGPRQQQRAARELGFSVTGHSTEQSPESGEVRFRAAG